MKGLPFSAIVGQADIKTALLICAVAPQVGGVLIFGKRGTAKSTAVRSLPNVLPEQAGVADCPYFCDPARPSSMCHKCAERFERGEKLPVARHPLRVVTLPLNASEDRLAGYFDLAAALQSGKAGAEEAFRPGLLADANRNVLYVDEVNLLADHLVDGLLDVAALGVNYIEREGLSEMHPARFLLVGTMNPEEGELRPQLLDRFGLAVAAENIRDVAQRSLISEHRLRFESDPAGLQAEFAAEEATLREQVVRARELYPQVAIPLNIRMAVAKAVAHDLRADGHRGDIVIDCAARALAALAGRVEVTMKDAEQALRLAMAHRAKELPNLRKIASSVAGEEAQGAGESPEEPTELAVIEDFPEPETIPEENFEPGLAGISRKIRAGEKGFPLKRILDLPRDRKTRYHTGRRFLSRTERRTGRYVRSHQIRPVTDLALDATLRAAALHQRRRGWQPGRDEVLKIWPDDFRQKLRERKSRALLIFAIDASDSVMSRQLIAATKRAVLALLQDAYEKRDRVAMLVFRFAQAYVVLEPTTNRTRAREALEKIYVGGCTPIATGLLESLRLVEKVRRRDATLYPVLVLFTDGLPNVGLGGNMQGDIPVRDALRMAEEVARMRIPATVIDTGPHFHPGIARKAVPEGICRSLAERMQGRYYVLSDLKDDSIFEEGA